ncbi:MAG: tRNA lysidine(34) synthetase TilS [Neisseriaceae bacterium]|nr:tRNA lysidine(34) synthetase TilS [Neisseriaceae bacterium]
MDSVALLHVLHGLQAEGGFRLQAVHVHHGISAYADDWVRFCEQLCASLNVPLRVVRVQLDFAAKTGLEAEARRARYQAFAASDAQVLVLGHHLDDQVETTLANLLRGGGVRALAAMPVVRPFGAKALWRPCLHTLKSVLQEYAQNQGLRHVEDDSNVDRQYKRNWIRHELLPMMTAYLPHAAQHILRTTELMQETLGILDEVLQQDMGLVCPEGVFDYTLWQGLSVARQHQVLLHYVTTAGLGTPRPDSLHDFARQLRRMGQAQKDWRLPKGHVYAYQGRLYAVAMQDMWRLQPWAEVAVDDVAATPYGEGELSWVKAAQGLSLAQIGQGLTLRPRASTDKIHTAIGHKNVKRVLQEKGVPPFLRPYWPVLVDADERCVAICGLAVASSDTIQPGYLPRGWSN